MWEYNQKEKLDVIINEKDEEMKSMEKKQYPRIENLKTRINKVQSTISLYNREISQTKASIDSKKFLLAKIEKNAGISKFESTLYKIFIVINRFLARIFNFLLEWIQRM